MVLGWEPDEAGLRLRITTPSDRRCSPGRERRGGRRALVRLRAGRAATHGEREGAWTAEVIRPRWGQSSRSRGPPPATSSTCSPPPARGSHVPRLRRLYSGDSVNPLSRCAATRLDPARRDGGLHRDPPSGCGRRCARPTGPGRPADDRRRHHPRAPGHPARHRAHSGTPPSGTSSLVRAARRSRDPRGSSRATGSSAECSTTSSRSRATTPSTAARRTGTTTPARASTCESARGHRHRCGADGIDVVAARPSPAGTRGCGSPSHRATGTGTCSAPDGRTRSRWRGRRHDRHRPACGQRRRDLHRQRRCGTGGAAFEPGVVVQQPDRPGAVVGGQRGGGGASLGAAGGGRSPRSPSP